MSTFEGDEYIPTIDAILSAVDLEKVSVKNIRGALQELFSVDLSPNKKQVNELILQRYYKHQEEKTNSDEDEIARRAEMERQDALLALKLAQGGAKRAITRSNNTVKPKKPKRKRNTDGSARQTSNTGFNKEMILSPALASFLGKEKCSRPQVVKALWKYIKEKQLQDPNDGRNIICDETLEELFKKSKYHKLRRSSTNFRKYQCFWDE